MNAQQPMGQGAGANRQMPTGRFYGKVVEATSNKGVEAASVQLVQNRYDSASKTRKDVVVGGMLTASNGEFSLENVQLFGNYKLKISAIGFKEYDKPVSFDLKRGPNADMSSMLSAIDKDLGNIKLDIDEKVLGGVTVTSTKSMLQLGIDRKIFNVDKNLVSTGGTAVDVMKNVPSLNVDIDGNVTLRNNAPQIFVDGRPTTLTLEQIPADAIESVEIITNPSAKFDASGGTSGILNIVLKKNKKVGYSGNLRASIDSRGKPGFGGDINLRQNKVNVFAAGNFNTRKSISTGTTDRISFVDTPAVSFHQEDRSVMEGMFGFGRVGMDYFISNRNTLSVSGVFARGKFDPNTVSDIYADTLYTNRVSNSNNRFRNFGGMLSFKHNFPKAGREFTADVTYNKSKNTNLNNINADFAKLPSYDPYDSSFQQRQEGSGNNSNLVMQVDYVNPINEKSKFETGFRTNIREVNSQNDFYYFDDLGNPIYKPDLSVKYNSRDQVIAAYGTYSNQMKTFGYQLGLRVESSVYEGEMPDKNQEFRTEFPVSLFPSVFLSQKLKNDQDLQLNYSRRINRPNFFQLFPFTDYSDILNINQGNPDLKPEFTNSLEVTYQKIFKNKDNVLASVYFKHTDNLITRDQIPGKVNNQDVIINTFINANSSYVTGLELISRNKVTKFWDLNSNLNLYTSKINIDDPAVPEQDQFISWFAKVNNTFRLPKNFTLQLSADYQSKTILPPGGSGGGRGGFGGGGMFGGGGSMAQGFIRANYGVDAGLRYEFLKDRTAAISVNVNDIFRTRKYDAHSETAYSIQDVVRRRDPQMVRVNFSWRFGKFDASLFKRKNTKAERESMNVEGGF